MNQGKGKVEFVKKNDSGYYSLLVDETWYGAGKSAPQCKKDDVISFIYTMNGKYSNIDPASIKVEESTVSQGKSVASAAGGNKNDYWENRFAFDVEKEKAYRFRAHRATAVNVAELMIEQGIVSLPTKKADQYDAVLALIDELTTHYVEADGPKKTVDVAPAQPTNEDE